MHQKLCVALFILSFVFLSTQEGVVGYYCNITHCSTCSSYNYCAKCQQGYLWSLDDIGQTYCKFVQCKIQFCQRCYTPNSCQKCQDSFYISKQGKCIKGQSQYYCNSNCLNCTSANTCNLCQYGYNLQQKKCEPNIPGYSYNCYALMVNRFCQICEDDNYLVPGYKFQRNQCQEPASGDIACNISHCLKCSSDHLCEVCLPRYSLNSSKCVENQCEDPYCLTCLQSSSVCQKCEKNFDLIDGKCLHQTNACNIQHCIDCSYQIELCSGCEQGYRAVYKKRYGEDWVMGTYICEKYQPRDPHCLTEKQTLENGIYIYQGCFECTAGYTNIMGSCMANMTKVNYECNISGCQFCGFPNFCTRCQSGYQQIQFLGVCWKASSTLPHCLKDYISYEDQVVCLMCEDPYQNYNGVCINPKDFICPRGCNTCLHNNTCVDCRGGFHKVNGTCQPYSQVANCYSGSSSNFCSLCEVGYIPNNDSSLCIKSSIIPKGQCSSSIQQGCAACSIYSRQDCLQCKQGYYLDENKCYEKYQNFVAKCTKYSEYSHCEQCESGFVLIKENCYRLGCNIANCEYCLRSETCLICKEGFILNNQSICEKFSPNPKCLDHCAVCDSNQSCLQCYDGYQLYLGTCVCPFQNCNKCLGDIMCVDCVPNFFPAIAENGGCVPMIFYQLRCQVQNCAQCYAQNRCSFCNIGYSIGSNGLCEKNKCKEANCQLCFGQQQFCYLCKDGFMQPALFSKQCYPASSQYSCTVKNCAYCIAPQSCFICYERFKLTGNKTCELVDCPKNCAYCLYDNICVICQEDFQFSENMTCVPQSPFSFSGISTCPQIDFCVYCQGSNSRQKLCYACIPGFQPSANKKICVEQKCQAENCQICIPNASPGLQQSLCMICQQGYFLDSYLRCVKYSQKITNFTCTVPNCISCSSKNEYCTTCVPGWSPIMGRCYSYIEKNCKMVANCQICMGEDENIDHCFSCEENYYLSQNLQCKAHRRLDMDSNWGLMLGVFIISTILTVIGVCYGLRKQKKKERREFELKQESLGEDKKKMGLQEDIL